MTGELAMTTLTLPVYDSARLAVALKEMNLPGQRSKTAITKLRRERNHRKVYERSMTVAARLNARLVGIYGAEIRRRGGETSIRTGKDRDTGLSVADRRDGLTLLHVAGWRYYSSRVRPQHAALSYLCGTDDSGRWAARVPGTITTVRAAENWITPAAVRHAGASGRRVRRQGDIYAVETTKAHDAPPGWVGDDRRYDKEADEWVTSHHWNAKTRTLVHRPEDGRKHRPLRLSYPVRFVQQQPYQMGRGRNRATGD
jgi:hypothetical protein